MPAFDLNLSNLLEAQQANQERECELSAQWLAECQKEIPAIWESEHSAKRDRDEKLAQQSTWERVNRYVGTVFAGLSLYVGVSLLATAGPALLPAALIGASVWRIGKDLIDASGKGPTLLNALLPAQWQHREKLASVLTSAASVAHFASELILLVGSGAATVELLKSIPNRVENVFQLASLISLSTKAGSGYSSFQAKSLAVRVTELGAEKEKGESYLSQQQSQIQQAITATQQSAQLTSAIHDADHTTKLALLSES